MLKQNYPNGYHISKGADDIYWILNEGEDYKGKLSTDLNKAKAKAEEKIGYVPDVVIWHRKSWEKFTYIAPPKQHDSHINIYNNHLEKIKLDILKKQYAKYIHIGTIGEKVNLQLTVSEIFTYYAKTERWDILTYCHKFIDQNGNHLIYFGNSKQFVSDNNSNFKVGDKITVKATIKDHSQERDNKYIPLTVLQRPSVVK
jgi:hypothetical protein